MKNKKPEAENGYVTLRCIATYSFSAVVPGFDEDSPVARYFRDSGNANKIPEGARELLSPP